MQIEKLTFSLLMSYISLPISAWLRRDKSDSTGDKRVTSYPKKEENIDPRLGTRNKIHTGPSSDLFLPERGLFHPANPLEGVAPITALRKRVVPRLRESRLLNLSGRGRRVHAT